MAEDPPPPPHVSALPESMKSLLPFSHVGNRSLTKSSPFSFSLPLVSREEDLGQTRRPFPPFPPVTNFTVLFFFFQGRGSAGRIRLSSFFFEGRLPFKASVLFFFINASPPAFFSRTRVTGGRAPPFSFSSPCCKEASALGIS